MRLDYDERTGRPLVNGREMIEELSDGELEQELTIAAEEPRQRAHRLAALLLERARRQTPGDAQLA
jgi:hypothetical protein